MSSSAVDSKEEKDNKKSILIVDDTPENIDVLDGILNEDYRIFVATNGPTALKLAKKNIPDLILLDVMMPEMDGYEVCEKLKEDEDTKKIPVVFVTAKTEVESEIKGFSLGAVDYITKPISPPIVQARVKTHLTIQNLVTQLEKDKIIVENANKQMMTDQEMAKAIYDKMVKKWCMELPNVKYLLKPMEVFAGDLMLVNKADNGNIYIMLGDFTGHGLIASVGVMPTSEIFYSMSRKGYDLSSIMLEINSKLHGSLPTGVFCAACAFQVNPKNNLIQLWNGWNPECLLLDKEGKIKHKFESKHMPLALQSQKNFDPSLEVMFLEEGDRLFVYSDGITEAKSTEGKMFEGDGVEAVFVEHKDKNTYFEEILSRVEKFSEGVPQGDDISLIEYHHHYVEEKLEENKKDAKEAK